jgi:hypothetical protein
MEHNQELVCGKVSPKQTKYNLQDSGAKPCWVEAASEYEGNAENNYKDLTKGYVVCKV